MDFQLFSFDKEVESQDTTITARKIKSRQKQTSVAFMRRQKLNELFDELPEEGETLRIMSNGSFDYYGFVPRIIELLKAKAETWEGVEFWFSTWTMNNENTRDILNRFDSGDIASIHALTGLYMKQREPQVFNTLYEGLKARGQRLMATENHSKVILIRHQKTYIVVEGSANFTANPRIEQNNITCSEEVFYFHEEWMSEIIQ